MNYGADCSEGDLMTKKTERNGLKQLKALHKDAINLLATGRYKEREVAEEIGVCLQTLSGWKKDPLFKEEYEKRLKEEDAWRRMTYRAQANRAMERLAELMESSHPTTAIAAVREMIRLAGDGGEVDKPAGDGSVGIVILPDIKK